MATDRELDEVDRKITEAKEAARDAELAPHPHGDDSTSPEPVHENTEEGFTPS